MIVIRFIKDNGDLTGEQDIYCNNPCYPDFKGWLGRDDVQFEIYSDEVVDHEKYLGHYPFIEDTFISKDDMEYCHGCMKQLNIFDEDMQQFRPRTETDNEIVSNLLIIDGHVMGSNINLNKFY